MTAADLSAVIRGIVPGVKEMIAGAVAGLTERVKSLEAREVINGKDGAPGKDGSSFSSGAGEPISEGRSGDVYLDSKTGDLFQWR